MPEVRRADPDDAAELTQLRVVMFHRQGRDPSCVVTRSPCRLVSARQDGRHAYC
jgi:hypothetical protein